MNHGNTIRVVDAPRPSEWVDLRDVVFPGDIEESSEVREFREKQPWSSQDMLTYAVVIRTERDSSRDTLLCHEAQNPTSKMHWRRTGFISVVVG